MVPAVKETMGKYESVRGTRQAISAVRASMSSMRRVGPRTKPMNKSAPVHSAPDIKPIAEVGLPSWPNTVAWQALLAPGGTPKPILEKLNKDVNAVVHSPEMISPLETLGMIGLGDKSLQQFDDFVKVETVRWAKVIKEANLAGTQ